MAIAVEKSANASHVPILNRGRATTSVIKWISLSLGETYTTCILIYSIIKYISAVIRDLTKLFLFFFYLN